jgi:hypothetical protein
MPGRGFIAFLVGLGVTAASALALEPFAILALPGWWLASLAWPQGVHTGSGLSLGASLAFIIVIYAGTFATWAGLTYSILVFRARNQHAV